MKNNFKVAVVGANGKMGSLICQRLSATAKIYGIDKKDDIKKLKNLDLVIDFASGASSAISAKFCAESKVPLIVGSTGQTVEELDEINEASKSTAVLMSSNFSLGIQTIKEILNDYLYNLNANVTILEKHHEEKLDKPSGTALTLKAQLEGKMGREVSVLSERGGKEIGTHKIDFYFNNELISIEHKAFSREVFVDGVMLAVEFIKGKSAGLYSFSDVVQNIQTK